MANAPTPVTFGEEQITREKLNLLANNVQWLVDNMPRVRYAAHGITRETGVKILSGKNTYQASKRDWQDIAVYFGNFFTAGCKPIVVAVVSEPSYGARKYVTVRGISGAAIDHTGFRAHIVQYEPAGHPKKIRGAGRVTWHAIGY